MIVADTSVWIDFFRDAPTRQVELLVSSIKSREVGVPDLVLTEVLQGCASEREFRRVRSELAFFPVVPVVDERVAIRSAQYYRTLRAKGVTVRKTIDALIATCCISNDLPLLFSDRDFQPFVAHFGLRSALDETGVN